MKDITHEMQRVLDVGRVLLRPLAGRCCHMHMPARGHNKTLSECCSLQYIARYGSVLSPVQGDGSGLIEEM